MAAMVTTLTCTRGDGNDTITEGYHYEQTDKLAFTDVNPDKVALVRDGDSVTIEIAASSEGTGDNGSILLVDGLYDFLGMGQQFQREPRGRLPVVRLDRAE
jgi:hypothetical protein